MQPFDQRDAELKAIWNPWSNDKIIKIIKSTKRTNDTTWHNDAQMCFHSALVLQSMAGTVGLARPQLGFHVVVGVQEALLASVRHMWSETIRLSSDYHPIIIRLSSDSSLFFKTLQDSSTSCAPVSVPGTMRETLLQPQLMHIFSTFAMEAGQHVCGKHANSGQIWDQHYPEHESSVHSANSIAKGNMTAT